MALVPDYIIGSFSLKQGTLQAGECFSRKYFFYRRLKIHTINGAIASAGRKFPTRIFLISNRLLIANPKSSTPPVAVNSFIIGLVMIVLSCAAHTLLPPSY